MVKEDESIKTDELNSWKRERLRRITDEGYRYYTPIGKMREFLNEAFTGKYATALMSSANGTGKTTTLINIVANLSRPSDNPSFQQPELLNWKHKRRGRIISDTATIKDTIVPELLSWLPKGTYKKWKNGKDYYSKFIIYDKDGRSFHWDLMTYEQDPKQFESANLGIVICDEPVPFKIYTASFARLKLGGLFLIFATPLGDNVGSAWMYQKIASDPSREANDFFYMTASKENACEEHGEGGFLPHQQILREMKQYPEEEVLPRIFGEFVQVKGRVIKEYDEKVHVLDNVFDANPNDYVVAQMWDTHPRVKEAIMWCAVDRKGNNFIVDELWSDEPLDSLIAKIKAIDSKYRIVKRLIDPSAFNIDKRFDDPFRQEGSSEKEGMSFARLLKEKYGLVYEPGSKRRSDGITLIRDALRFNFQAGVWIKYPELFIQPHCTQTQWEFLNWMWQEWSGKTAEIKDPKAIPQDKNDHMMENLGRFFLENIEFTEPIQEVIRSISRGGLVENVYN